MNTQDQIKELLREAADNAQASLAETDISDDRRRYREGLRKRLIEARSRLTTDTWTSGKILPTPDHDRIIADDYLAIRKDAERVTIETFWHDIDEWRDNDDQPIQISAWRRIPMDGIDEAVAEGDRP